MQLVKVYFLYSLLTMNCHIPKLSKFATRWPTIIHSLSSSAAMHHQVPANSNIGKHIVSSLVSPNVAFTFVIPHLFLIKESSFPILLTDIYHFNNALYVCPRVFIIVLLTQLFSNKMLTNKIFSWLFYKSAYLFLFSILFNLMLSFHHGLIPSDICHLKLDMGALPF